MKPWNRRKFLKAAGTGIATSASAYWGATAWGRSAPSQRVRHAVIGTGGRGQHHARAFAGLNGCKVVAVCDVDPERREKAVQDLPHPDKVARYGDYRRLLENEQLDSISIATCDHWHTPIALAGLVSGLHVYVEKPSSHNVRESDLLVQAAKEFGRCVQLGTQNRSSGDIREGIRQLRQGAIGRVRAAKAVNHQLRGPIGRAPVTEPPPGVDYDLWLGPAPKHGFTKNRWHYTWHWFWDYGSGDLGNDGIHHVDLARWALGVGYPDVTVASGAQLFYDDDHENPDTQNVIYQYPEAHLIYEMRLWTSYPMDGLTNGIIVYGDDGLMKIGHDRGVEVILADGESKRIRGDAPPNHMQNFIDAVKAEKPSLLAAPIEEGAISANLCHLGNIGTRLGGRALRYDPQRRQVLDDAEATALLQRQYREPYGLPYTG